MPAPAKILLVEDDDINRLIVGEALRDAGYEVIEAETADRAILLLNTPNFFNLLFTDVRMPGTLDGLDLIVEVRKTLPEVPVVVASGYAVHLTERFLALSPPAKFIQKPFQLHQVLDAIDGLISRGGEIRK